MGLIAVEGMHFYAYHGVYEEEQIIGSNFVVDIYIETTFDAAAAQDNVFETINYETVFLVCQSVMRKRVNLVETVCANIIQALKYQFKTIQEVKVRIRKQVPLPGSKLESVYIESDASFVRACPRCGNPFLCYKDDSCWCHDLQVHPRTQDIIRKKYDDCLCKDCLTFYAG